MKILALDLGTKTGYAIAHGPRLVGSGVIDLSGRRHEGGGMRFVRFARHVEELLAAGVNVVVYEEVRRHLGTDAAHIYGGLLAIVQAECERRQIPYQGVPVATIKKHATGRGNADKAAMIEAARSAWPHLELVDDNHADALHLLDLAIETFAPITPTEAP